MGPDFEAGLENLKAIAERTKRNSRTRRPLRRRYCVEVSRFCGMFIQITYVPNCFDTFSTMVTYRSSVLSTGACAVGIELEPAMNDTAKLRSVPFS